MFTCVLSGLQLGIAYNLLADQVKIGVLNTGLVQELSPFFRFLLIAIGFFLGIYFGIIRKQGECAYAKTRQNNNQGQ